MNRRVFVTGGTGLVGRFFVEHFLAKGDYVTVGGRSAPRDGFFSSPIDFRDTPLDPDFDFSCALEGADVLIHGAFSHIPGRYRGGEGDDPAAFKRQNLEGTARLFSDAKATGVKALIFLSSRAAYGPVPAGTPLTEDMTGEPDTLYGQVKKEGEAILASLADHSFKAASLRITGVYGPAGPGANHKWVPLFEQFQNRAPISARAATEVHGDDVAAAAETLLGAPPEAVTGGVFNVSDVIVDNRDILTPLADRLARQDDLPARGDPSALCEMSTQKLRALGWRPGGLPLFKRTTDALAASFVAS
ncbi:MAG: NAD-dependent epimerase/dehydratase family protein [Parvularcula sp.]